MNAFEIIVSFLACVGGAAAIWLYGLCSSARVDAVMHRKRADVVAEQLRQMDMQLQSLVQERATQAQRFEALALSAARRAEKAHQDELAKERLEASAAIADVCAKQDELRRLVELERGRANRFGSYEQQILESLQIIRAERSVEWFDEDQRWLVSTLASGSGFRLREKIVALANNAMVAAISSDPTSTREWRCGYSIGFRALLSAFKMYSELEYPERISEPGPLARQNGATAPEPDGAMPERRRYTP